MIEWPKGPTAWYEGRRLCVSIPFTWDLPEVRKEIEGGSLLWDSVLVGGPAVKCLPAYFDDLPFVAVGDDCPGVLQRANPQATRTTVGCIRKCGFCAIGKGLIEAGGLRELQEWPDLPIIADNNLLAASESHFDRVIDRLLRWGWADFNQGIDARLLTEHHAKRLAEIKRPMIRLALDSDGNTEAWNHAFGLLRAAGIAKSHIRSYCLVGFHDTPADAWRRCLWVQSMGVKALPMWFHPLDTLERNPISKKQERAGWSKEEQANIIGWHYKHRGHCGPLKEWRR
jgi:hypothetical protein